MSGCGGVRLAADAVLINGGAEVLLTVPNDKDDPQVGTAFLDAQAQAYVLDQDEAAQRLPVEHGLRKERITSRTR